jgi:hypothetical protein
MKLLLYNIARWIGYTIVIEDHHRIENNEWVVDSKHLSVYKYMGKWKHDNSIKLKRVWTSKIR